MSPTLARIAFLTIAMSVCHPEIGRSQEKVGSWMDAVGTRTLEHAWGADPRRTEDAGHH